MVHRISLNGADWQMKGFIGEDWLWRSAHTPENRGGRLWSPASVPGSVQNDLWQAGMIPDPYFEMNSLAIEWVPERTWLYRKAFTVSEELRGRRVQLVFQGVDYSARYYLNGEELGRSEGMFLPVRFDISQKLVYGAENFLVVVIDPAPFEQPQIGYTSSVSTQKTRMNYWWDFCPRMVHLGIWEDVYLAVSGPAYIADVWVQSELTADLGEADVSLTITLEAVGGEKVELDTALLDPENREAASQRLAVEAGPEPARVNFKIADPAVWWPNGAGDQPLYKAVVTARVDGEVSHQRQVRFGIRRIKFIPNEDANPQALPYTLLANGRRLYINGWNWVPMDVLYGAAQPHKRQRLLRLAQKAHVNLLRIWGGGLIESEAFYDLCDRLGILVWQEFIQSSSGVDNVPSEETGFIDFLVQNAAAAIRQRRNHPALAVWCGGNELHVSATDLCDDSHPALAALKETINRLDPGRHWVASSPSGGRFAFQIPDDDEMGRQMHDVHGPWEYQGLRKHYALYNQGESLLHSEFGAEGLTNLRTLDKTISPEQQWPVSLENPVWEHLGAWWVKEQLWAELFGPMGDVATIQRVTQFLQADGLRYAVEADRRRMYHNSGTMPWQFNEPYPMGACTSAVDYYAGPKPVYYAVARAYRPLSLTARFDRLAWGGEDGFRAEIWSSNAGREANGQLTARLIGRGGRVFHSASWPVTCVADQSRAIASIDQALPDDIGDFFILDLNLKDDSGAPLTGNRYIFSNTTTLRPLLEADPSEVTTAVEKGDPSWVATLSNEGQETALWCWLEVEKADLRAANDAYFSDNYFCLLPGERRSVRVEWESASQDERAIILAGWNFAGQTIR